MDRRSDLLIRQARKLQGEAEPEADQERLGRRSTGHLMPKTDYPRGLRSVGEHGLSREKASCESFCNKRAALVNLDVEGSFGGRHRCFQAASFNETLLLICLLLPRPERN